MPQSYSDDIFIYLPLIRQNVLRAQKYCRLIANNLKQFTIVFPYRFLAFALLLVANNTIEQFLFLASCLRSSAIIGDERERCFHLCKLFVIKLSEGACDCLRRSYARMETAAEKFRMISLVINRSQRGVEKL